MVRTYQDRDKNTLDIWSQIAFQTKVSNNDIDLIYVFEEEEIKGFISFRILYERAELNYLYVDLKYRNQNIASTLLDTMYTVLKDKNVKTVTLEVSVQNPCAIHVYEKIGFKQIGQRKNYYNGVDALLMIKEVS